MAEQPLPARRARTHSFDNISRAPIALDSFRRCNSRRVFPRLFRRSRASSICDSRFSAVQVSSTSWLLPTQSFGRAALRIPVWFRLLHLAAHTKISRPISALSSAESISYLTRPRPARRPQNCTWTSTPRRCPDLFPPYPAGTGIAGHASSTPTVRSPSRSCYPLEEGS
jgi:hypothetical protein